MISITVPMAAFGKARPRVVKTRRGKSHTFMPDEYQAKRDELRWHCAGIDIPDGPVHLSITAVRQLPKSWSKKRRAEMLGTYSPTIPDVDNIAGAIMDALFKQDNQVVTLFCEKIWGEEHELRIEIVPDSERKR